LLEVSLAAIPLLLKAQRAVAWQVYTAMGATNHGRCIEFAGRMGGFVWALELAPEPYCCSNQGNPEQ